MAELKLSARQRSEILDQLYQVVVDRFFDPHLRGINWKWAVERHREEILSSESAEQFEKAVMRLLEELQTSHIGFYHKKLRTVSSKMAVSATYAAFPFEQEERWIFQDVHEGGAAHLAGIRSGDVLDSVNGRIYRPADHPVFPLGSKFAVRVLTGTRKVETRTVVSPAPRKKWRQLPYAEPKLVSHKRLNHEVGYLKVTMYPGIVGVEIAREILAAVRGLDPIRRLIVDLRGNTGGGIGVLRLMSLLTPESLPVGFNVNRNQMEQSMLRDHFPVFDRIPSRKIGLLPLLRLLVHKYPVLVSTEGLGPQPFHKRVVLLVNRHTASSNEMLVSFARENGLASIVGEATPGRLMNGEKYDLSYGYVVALPIGAYHTAAGCILEGTPIEPDHYVPFDPVQAQQGEDPQLDAALEVVSRL